MTQEPWVPQRVRGLERELIHAEEHLKTLDRDRDETRDRIANLKHQIEKETGPVQAVVTNWGGATE